MLVEVHTISRLAVNWLRHKRNCFFVLGSDHFGGVFDQHDRISGRNQSHHRDFDLQLARAAHLVVVIFDRDSHYLQMIGDLVPQIIETVFRWSSMITPMHGDI